jgi:glucokinase
MDLPFASIGVSCGGPIDAKNGIILSPPNPPGWNGIHISGYLSKNHCALAFLRNDACAFVEWKHGGGQGL